MATDEDGKIRSRHIKYEVIIVALILVNGRTLGTKEAEQLAENRNRKVCNRIQILVGERLTSLITSRKLGILSRRSDLLGFIHDVIHMNSN